MLARHNRLLTIVIILITLGGALALTLRALDQQVTFFYAPSEIALHKHPENKDIRIGGLVKTGSLKRLDDGLSISFTVTDNLSDLVVKYKGIVPDLFREGQGIVATGRLSADGIFIANTLLAKHDERYMPPEVANALRDKTPHKGTTP